MPLFSFKGRDQFGKILSGKRQAITADLLGAELFKQGIVPFEIKPVTQRISDWTRIKLQLGLSVINSSDLSLFCRQMNTLCRAGIPITMALSQLAESTRDPFFSQILWELVGDIESGQNLASAMKRHPEIFPRLMIGLIQVGETSGKLDETFLQLTQYFELEEINKKRVQSTLRYPTFVFISIIVAVIIVDIYVIPSFAKVFTTAHIELPWATKVLIGISAFTLHYWVYLLFLLGTAIWGLIYYLRTPQGKLAWDRYKLKIPIIGVILEKILIARCAKTFAIMVQAGVPPVESIELVAGAFDNAYACQQILSMRNILERGEGITRAASNSKLFPPLVLQMLAVGEETGTVDKMLQEIALYYEREIDYELKRLGDTLEPVMLIALATLIMILALAVYGPIWGMAKLAAPH